MRHILIMAAAVCEAIQRNEIEMVTIPGEYQIADALTKALLSAQFLEFRKSMLE